MIARAKNFINRARNKAIREITPTLLCARNLRLKLAAKQKKQKLKYNIEHFSEYNGHVSIGGWAFFNNSSVAKISYSTSNGLWRSAKFTLLESSDVAEEHDAESAKKCRFFITISKNIPTDTLSLKLSFQSEGGIFANIVDCSLLHIQGIDRGPFRNFVPDFFETYVKPESVKTVLEIGSRARSGANNRDIYVPKEKEFTGIDITAGDAVDVVCDAHKLSEHLEKDKYDVVYSLNVFEHLLMPWKVVLELNKVMKNNGVVMIFTHHSFPLHDLPWDYFRFSDNAWHALFNKETGFEVISTELLDEVSIVPKCIYEGSVGVKDGPAFIHSAVIARKIGASKLTWDVDSDSIMDNEYSH